ncbi:MAG: UMP kinase [Aigarchaeota archaeon]|nr:UMP kinase [Aigarchaeota archaeon]MDW8021955.1 UMP kinase [Nitrososphaerota archaeon]
MPSSLIIKLGGHLISTKEGIQLNLLENYAKLFSRLFDGGKWCIVVGGGEEARRYIAAARELGIDEASCDLIAVEITRIHARLLSTILGDKAYQSIPKTLEEIVEFSSHGKIVVSGGLQPAQSTTAVAALAAEALAAKKLIIATDVDGVYTRDPKTNPDAEFLEEVALSRLREILAQSTHHAGEYKLIDSLAMRILERSRIQAIVVNGKRPENVEKAILGERIGTRIIPE